MHSSDGQGRRQRLLPLVPLLLAFSLLAVAQRPGRDEVRVSSHAYRPPPLTIRASAVSVEADVVVRDGRGDPIAGLQRSNFRIFDNGRPQPLSGFSIATSSGATRAKPRDGATAPLPAPPQRKAAARQTRNLALFFDDVNSSAADLAHARDAAEQFIAHSTAGGGRIGIFTASSLQSVAFTGDHARLIAAIRSLRPHPRATRYTSGCVHVSAYQAYLIVNHLDPSALEAAIANTKACSETSEGAAIFGVDGRVVSEGGPIGSIWLEARMASQATLAAIRNTVDYLGSQPGSRVLIIASGGFLGQTLEAQQDQIIQQALRDRITIDGLDAGGLYARGPGLPLDQQSDVGVAPLAMFVFNESSKMPEHEAMDAAMANLAQSTGGLLFQNNNNLALGFERFGLVASVTYRLSFAPENLVANGKLHRLSVKVIPDRGYTIEARRGYFAPPPEGAAAKLAAAIDTAMRDRVNTKPFQASVRTAPAARGIAIAIHVDLAQLDFRHATGRERNRLTFTAALYAGNGKFITGKQATMDFALKSASWHMLRQRGLTVHLTLPASGGRYILRLVVASGNDGKLDAMSQAVTVD